MKPAFVTLAAVLLALATPPPASAELPPLLPRTLLFRNGEYSSPLVSPDGQHLLWIAPTNGIPNLWVRSLNTNVARILSLDPRGSIRQPTWQPDAQGVLYLQEHDEFGNLHVMQAHLATGIIRDLTPFTGIQARIVATSPRVPDEILVSLNLRNRRWFDVYRADLRTGALTFEAENSGDVTAWYADHDLNVSLAQVSLPNGETALSTRSDPRSVWRPLLRWGTDDALGRVFGFGNGNSNVHLLSTVRAQSHRLLSLDLATGTATTLAQDARFAVSSALFHPTSHVFEAAQFDRARAQWQLANTNLLRDLEALRRFRNADLDILSRDQADQVWTVSYSSADAPLLFALFQRATQTITPLASDNPGLESAKLGSTRGITFSARDGLPLAGYLTLPAGVEPKGLPAVVLVHGGPWARVLWTFDPQVHWLANRGYAVLQVNFRGSDGYGKDHLNAGNKEWGGKILLDLIDAKKWAADQGFIDPQRTAIMGSGFGGYATLAALAQHPTEFAAGLSVAGPVSLLTMVQSVPASATAARAVLDRRVGSPSQEPALLTAHSPASRPNLIKNPVLIAATGRDPQAPSTEVDAFVAAIRRDGRNVDYLFFPDEAISLRNPANQLRFYAAAEAFLAKHLRGRAEPPSVAEQFESLRR